jgi:hypothetical protein
MGIEYNPTAARLGSARKRVGDYRFSGVDMLTCLVFGRFERGANRIRFGHPRSRSPQRVFRDRSILISNLVVIGEVGLGGQVRSIVSQMELRDSGSQNYGIQTRDRCPRFYSRCARNIGDSGVMGCGVRSRWREKIESQSTGGECGERG